MIVNTSVVRGKMKHSMKATCFTRRWLRFTSGCGSYEGGLRGLPVDVGAMKVG